MKKVLTILIGLLLGVVLGRDIFSSHDLVVPIFSDIPIFENQKQIIGFLPFGLLDRANKNYSKYITELSYFALTLDTDGTILKLTNPQQEEPGWYDLSSGKADPILSEMKQKNIKLSLVVFNGNNGAISSLLSDPITHADNLVNSVSPVMKKYGFRDLNLDIESTNEASDEARLKFTQFSKRIKDDLDKNSLGTLTVDVTPVSFVRNYLIDPKAIGSFSDYVLIMAYDYHFPGSTVTGPVAPLYGAGNLYEFDTNVPVTEALKIMSKEKIILGLPLYGYEWETISSFPASAIIPSTALISSNRRVEQFLASCSNCSLQRGDSSKEQSVTYQDSSTQTYHQIFYPDEMATGAKVNFAKQQNLGGIGLWALGYEGNTILNPLLEYK